MKRQQKPGYSDLVYLAPSGDWGWRIFQGGEDVVRGAGYPNWKDARSECQEILHDYDTSAEVVVETPAEPFWTDPKATR